MRDHKEKPGVPVPREHRSSSAFSLVEVTIAMAIAAVSIVTLLGLIPQGMNTMQEAGDVAIMGRVQQQILNELQLTPFSDSEGNSLLDPYHELEIFYDAQGEEMGDTNNNSDQRGSFEHIYTAKISISDDGRAAPSSVGGTSFGAFTFSGEAGFDGGNEYVRQVIIEVAAVAGLADDFDFEDPENAQHISTFQTLIVKTGQDFIEE